MPQISFAQATDYKTGETFELAHLDMNCPECGRHVRFAVNREDPITMANELEAMQARYDRLKAYASKQEARLDNCLKILANLRPEEGDPK